MISFEDKALFRFQSDAVFVGLLRGCALVAGGLILLILGFLFWETVPLLYRYGPGRFLFDPSWNPGSDLYNMRPMMWASLLITLTSMVLAAPIGILSGIFCQYYASPVVSRLYRRIIELLAGIPSVVYGLWGLVVLVPLIREIRPPGPSLLAGTIILSIMILPTIALTADASFASVPRKYVEGAAALGMSRWGMIRGVLFPAAKSGILTGMILASARAIGETMAVLMVCGNVVQIPGSLFDSVRTLTANIALEMAYAMGDHRSALFVSGLFLLLMIIVLIGLAEAMRFRRSLDEEDRSS